MVIEGDSALTTSDTTLSCNPSSVNLEGGSSYIHLDDYIEWNPSRVFPRGSPWCLRHNYYGYCDFTLNHVTKDGSALRGTRASLIASDVGQVDLEGAREIITRRGRAFLALAAST